MSHESQKSIYSNLLMSEKPCLSLCGAVRCVGGNKNGIIITIIIKVFECVQAHDDGVNPIPLNASGHNERIQIKHQTTWPNRFGDHQIAGTSWTTIICGVNKSGRCFHSHLVVTRSIFVQKAHKYICAAVVVVVY